MKLKLLLIPVLLLSINSIAQDLNYNWSVEANYSIINDGKLIRDANGIIDLGVKYRFLDLEFAKIGIGINGGYFGERTNFDENTEFKAKQYFIQPRIFAEFDIPNINRLHPNLGLGYSFVSTRFSGTYFESDASVLDSNSRGINVNLGVLYDISKKVFVQANYDLISGDNRLNTYRIGFGFRF